MGYPGWPHWLELCKPSSSHRFSAREHHNISGISFDAARANISAVTNLDVCAVELALTHLELGTRTVLDFGVYAQQGFVVGTTDGGNISDDETVLRHDILQPAGGIDLDRFTDFSSRALHELALVSKAVAKSFYHSPPKYAYWSGCPTGRRLVADRGTYSSGIIQTAITGSSQMAPP
ncbi:hypothetical protein BJY01DRAFT_249007 [Aspergillus pseudoustus]|uniref:Carboxylic ester hydrolase n=1 Tax=Aspergillus pseudoustus TaxID=1810923 RepID=A0ABR4JR57_9EURO